MSLSPGAKHAPHTTPFSVTDILSPIEESYRKLDLCGPGSPYRSSGSSAGGTISPAPMGTPGPSPYMHMHQFPAQYCNGGDPISYGNTSATGWYPSTANDPRFASKWFKINLWTYIAIIYTVYLYSLLIRIQIYTYLKDSLPFRFNKKHYQTKTFGPTRTKKSCLKLLTT